MTQTAAPLSILSRDLIAALAVRPNATEAETRARAAALGQQIQALAPTDAIETMFAGHAVAMGVLLARVIADLGRATTPEQERRLRREIVSLSRTQQGFVKEIRLHRKAKAPPKRVPVQTAAVKPAQTRPPVESAPSPAVPFINNAKQPPALPSGASSRAMFAALGAG